MVSFYFEKTIPAIQLQGVIDEAVVELFVHWRNRPAFNVRDNGLHYEIDCVHEDDMEFEAVRVVECFLKGFAEGLSERHQMEGRRNGG